MDEDMLDTKINIENKKTERMSIAFNTNIPQLYIYVMKLYEFKICLDRCVENKTNQMYYVSLHVKRN